MLERLLLRDRAGPSLGLPAVPDDAGVSAGVGGDNEPVSIGTANAIGISNSPHESEAAAVIMAAAASAAAAGSEADTSAADRGEGGESCSSGNVARAKARRKKADGQPAQYRVPPDVRKVRCAAGDGDWEGVG